MLKIHPLFIYSSIPLFLSISSSSSAHFFQNISSIPTSSIPKPTSWDNFHTLVGCRTGQNVAGLSRLKQYFQHFGYCNYSTSNFTDNFDDTLESAIKTYQLNFNLNITGELDDPTLTHLIRPRCGNADIINGSSSMNFGKVNFSYSNSGGSKYIHSVGHYSFFPGQPRWPPSRTTLLYAFFPGNQLPENVKAVFGRAFGRWSEVTTLTFTETRLYYSADIKIGFFSGDHGDGEPFDGVLGTLAHAFSPPGGKFHLDGDENWVVNGDFVNASSSMVSAVDLESVAVHEIGHLLGLGHSSVEESIMYPTLSSSTRKVELDEDDIEGIQSLYGSNPNYNGSTTMPDFGRETSGAHTLLKSFLIICSVFGIFMDSLL
ncbi:metalloprotease [Lithospermum erythrorhizon]|uniref:Metalloprotease n=1 Tax=Lithospermum erythrorhizon TaxID=34254 RepID=A0AAV3QXX9_LITER